MKVLVLCGVFEEKHEREVIALARRSVEFSANLFQQKLIRGLRATSDDVTVLSAPFIGAFPTAASKLYFNGFQTEPDDCRYVNFNNLWGVRNVSRAAALKRAISPFAEAADEEKFILIYCPHTPFLRAAAYAKKKDPNIRICLYVPDLPEFMNLSKKVSPLYRVAKKLDIAAMTRAMQAVDTFVLLTEAMKERLPVGEKPCFVCEGLIGEDALSDARARLSVLPAAPAGRKTIVYTGKTDERFGIKTLVDAMAYVPDPDCELILCGTGDADDYAVRAAKRDGRIRPLGQLSPAEARRRQLQADVLVNPRSAAEEYTRYSFPSKTIEYLLSGAAVVAHFLPGMPEAYREFLLTPASDDPRDLAEALKSALGRPNEERKHRTERFLDYAEEHLLANRVAEHILRQGR